MGVWPSLGLVPFSTVWHWAHFWKSILPFSTSLTFKLSLGHVWYKISRYKSDIHSLHNFSKIFFFFDVDHFNVFIEFVTILFCILVFWSGGKWDPSFPSRDWTWSLCIGKRRFNHWTTREDPTTLEVYQNSLIHTLKVGEVYYKLYLNKTSYFKSITPRKCPYRAG